MIPGTVPCPVCGEVLRPNAARNFPRHSGCKGGLTSAVEAMAARRAEDAARVLTSARERLAALVASTAEVDAAADQIAATYRRNHLAAIDSAESVVELAESDVARAGGAL